MINAIIIDDEQDAVEALSFLINTHCRNIKIIATANSISGGARAIQTYNPDIVFLDVEMPEGSGFDILKRIKDRNFQLIFVTAYDHYAIDAIKFSAVDYLLKPVDVDDLVNAVEKARKNSDKLKREQYDMLLENLLAGKPQKLALPDTDGFQYINIKQIIRIEAERSYSTFYMEGGKKIMVSQNIGVYEELLNKSGFYRIHHSHLINIDHIHRFVKTEGGAVIMADNSRVPVSRRNREELYKILNLK